MIHKKIDAARYKKTKILATIGPASQEKIEDLLLSGVNGVRLNFSHNTHAWHINIAKLVRDTAKKLDRSVAIVQDLPGPKIRIGKLPAGGKDISTGEILTFKFDAKDSDKHIPIQYDFSKEVKVGQRLFLRDGQIQTVIKSVAKGIISAKAINSGKILSDHGINLPDTVFVHGILSEKDKKDMAVSTKVDADYVAVSFVHTKEDIENARNILKTHKSDAKIIAKIETKSAVENLEDIIKATDAVMIARGDLAIEIGPEKVPIVGREIILLARRYKKPVIMATQMLESMTSSTTPTRAEANDVATAVSLGVDCLMLSGETAIGQFPIETVKMMKRIILSSEQYFVTTSMSVELVEDTDETLVMSIEENEGLMNRLSNRGRLIFSKEPFELGKISSAVAQSSVSYAAITLADQVKAKVIIAETLTGSTALSITSLRPPAPIVVLSTSQRVCNQCSILWGSKTFIAKKTKRDNAVIIRKLKDRGSIKKGDWVVEAFGQVRGVAGGTDTIRLMEVK